MVLGALLWPGLAWAKTYMVLSADYGEGHNSAAAAYKAAILAREPDAKFVEINLRHYLKPKWLAEKSKEQFNASQRKGSILYDLLFEFYMQLGRFKSPGEMPNGHLFDLERLYADIHAAKPDVLISTYPFATEVIAYFKERGLLNLPTLWQHTDMVPRKYFAKLGTVVDRVCVAHEKVAQSFRNFFKKEGFSPNKVLVTGMPISLPPPQSPEARRQLLIAEGFDPDLPIVVIEGGSNGVGPYTEFIEGLHRKSPIPIQIVAMCAKNPECKERVDALKLSAKGMVKTFKAYPFLRNTDPIEGPRYFGLIESATVVMTKPGGLSPFERMARGLALVLHSVRTSASGKQLSALSKEMREHGDTPAFRKKVGRFLRKILGRTPQPEDVEEFFRIMSQEGYNAELLAQEGLALLSRDADHAVDQVIELLTKSELRAEMQANQRAFIKSMSIQPAVDWLTSNLPKAIWPESLPNRMDRCAWILRSAFAPGLSKNATEIYKLRKTRKENVIPELDDASKLRKIRRPRPKK